MISNYVFALFLHHSYNINLGDHGNNYVLALFLYRSYNINLEDMICNFCVCFVSVSFI